MRRIRAVIVDDEPHARRTLRGLLARDDEYQVVGEAANGARALELIASCAPDLVLLDVEMPGMNGFQVLERLETNECPQVVFVTAYDEYAIRAFEVNAVDYVLKPFDDERFATALARAKDRVRLPNWSQVRRQLQSMIREYGGDPMERPVPAAAGVDRGNDGYLERIAVKRGRTATLVPVDEIDWIEAANYCVRLHVKRHTYLVRDSLTRLESQLDPKQFVRVHRSAMVRVDRVREVEPFVHGDYVLVLKDGTKVRMSRSRRDGVRRALGLGDAP